MGKENLFKIINSNIKEVDISMENSSRALIIRYNNKLNGSILYKCSYGIIPKELEETKLLFIMTYPNILKELIRSLPWAFLYGRDSENK